MEVSYNFIKNDNTASTDTRILSEKKNMHRLTAPQKKILARE